MSLRAYVQYPLSKTFELIATCHAAVTLAICVCDDAKTRSFGIKLNVSAVAMAKCKAKKFCKFVGNAKKRLETGLFWG